MNEGINKLFQRDNSTPTIEKFEVDLSELKEFLNIFCFQHNPEEDIKNLFITQDKNLQEEFTEWFFSGNWILYEKKEEENY